MFSKWMWCYVAKCPIVQLWKQWACALWLGQKRATESLLTQNWAAQGRGQIYYVYLMPKVCVTLCECVCVKDRVADSARVCSYLALCAVCVCIYAGICTCGPGCNERVTLGGAADALFAFRQGGIQEQVSVSQHSQYWSLWTLGHLHICTLAQ